MNKSKFDSFENKFYQFDHFFLLFKYLIALRFALIHFMLRVLDYELRDSLANSPTRTSLFFDVFLSM